MAHSRQIVQVDGRRIVLTNLDKVLYPETGTTKGDVIAYYAAIAPALIRHSADRPATRIRWADGVGTAEAPEQSFFQKTLDGSTPDWVLRRPIEHKDHTNEYPLINDVPTLVWLAQTAALEIHVPQWRFDLDGVPQNPDRLVLDLDPGEGAGLAECAEVARLARTIFNGMGIEPIPVTSGSKGIHLYASLDGKQTSAQVSAVAHELARALESQHPDLVVSDMKRSLRHGKVLVDWSQNNASKTTIAPYSLRGRPQPFVAAPRKWDELANANLTQLDYADVLAREQTHADPLASLTHTNSSSNPALHDSPRYSTTISGRKLDVASRLETYVAKRDPLKTPEPMGGDSGKRGAEQIFVIQEHHARRLHFDFRLEHDGVLVSWAIPKGVPKNTGTNHLAVQTEDHPLAYATFEGRIPEGEYGAGDVTIWDAGTNELEKWREGKEVIVNLHGTKPGGLEAPTRFALIKTSSSNPDDNRWLIHRMKDGPASHGHAITHHGTRNTPDPLDPAGTNPPSVPLSHQSGNGNGNGDVIPPMLATLGSANEEFDGDWVFEMKWDGVRAISYLGKRDSDVRILSRNGRDFTKIFPEVASTLREALGPGECVVDGEIVALNSRSRPDFGLIQKRLRLTTASEIEKASTSSPVQYLVFDLLSHTGRPLLSKSYSERRSRLYDAVTESGAVHVPPDAGKHFAAAYKSSRKLELEGVIAKESASTYDAGRRSAAWKKIKHHSTQEVVIGGWRQGRGHRATTFASLILGIPDHGGLRYVGRVGTGFTDKQLSEIATQLGPRRHTDNPFLDIPEQEASDAQWVTPDTVAEIEFSGWTAAGRLRHPVWRGLRLDKIVDEVQQER